MRIIRTFVVVILAISHLAVESLQADPKPGDVDYLVYACKGHCPEAKTPAETIECLGRGVNIDKVSKQSSCWLEKERYEKLIENTKKLKK